MKICIYALACLAALSVVSLPVDAQGAGKRRQAAAKMGNKKAGAQMGGGGSMIASHAPAGQKGNKAAKNGGGGKQGGAAKTAPEAGTDQGKGAGKTAAAPAEKVKAGPEEIALIHKKLAAIRGGKVKPDADFVMQLATDMADATTGIAVSAPSQKRIDDNLRKILTGAGSDTNKLSQMAGDVQRVLASAGSPKKTVVAVGQTLYGIINDLQMRAGVPITRDMIAPPRLAPTKVGQHKKG